MFQVETVMAYLFKPRSHVYVYLFLYIFDFSFTIPLKCFGKETSYLAEHNEEQVMTYIHPAPGLSRE